MKKSRRIQLAQLFRLNACYIQTDRFINLFGKQVMLTQALAKVHADDFSWYWAGCYLLKKDKNKWRFFEYKKLLRRLCSTGKITLSDFRRRSAACFARLYILEGEKRARNALIKYTGETRRQSGEGK